MILQALVNYYEALAANGLISKPGWGKMKVSCALELKTDGELLAVHSLRSEVQRGKKTVMVPREMELPQPVKRTSSPEANFLCDNSSYILGFDDKGKPENSLKRFNKAKENHLALLKGSNEPQAKAICAFFEKWEPEKAAEHPVVAANIDLFKGGANLIFLVGESFPHENPAIRDIWQQSYDTAEDKASEEDVGKTAEPPAAPAICLVTGARARPMKVHPSIKGVKDAQSSGAALVSFNAPAFLSYGKEQNLNAPVSRYAAFAYTTALNLLLSDREHRLQLGDSTVIFWAENAQPAYGDVMAAFLGGDGEQLNDRDLREFMHSIARGEQADWGGVPIDPETPFCILALAPNAARLSVRFFLQNSFGAFAENIEKHYDDIYIAPDDFTRFDNIPLWALLQETVNMKSNNKQPSPQMAGDALRAVLTGSRYPVSLYQGVQLRIRAERSVTRGRAAIIKAYLKRNTRDQNYKEAAKMQLNQETTYQPYILGRLFAVLESIQEYANPGLNATIKDKYFTSACATPGHIFPILINLSNKHLRKIDNARMRVYFSKQFEALADMITSDYAAHHNLHEQGVFQLGYFHQRQSRFQSKSEENSENGGK